MTMSEFIYYMWTIAGLVGLVGLSHLKPGSTSDAHNHRRH